MSGWKKITLMVGTKKFADVKFPEFKHYLENEGYKLEEGTKHVKVMTRNGAYLAGISRQKTIRSDQLRYILKQIGRL